MANINQKRNISINELLHYASGIDKITNKDNIIKEINAVTHEKTYKAGKISHES